MLARSVAGDAAGSGLLGGECCHLKGEMAPKARPAGVDPPGGDDTAELGTLSIIGFCLVSLSCREQRRFGAPRLWGSNAQLEISEAQ